LPPTPGRKVSGPPSNDREREAARQKVLQLYKFRETSKPPIGLPRAPATALDPRNSPSEESKPTPGSFITIPQLTAPTGAFQVPEAWIRALTHEEHDDTGEANERVRWWLSGSLYRAIMAAFPRIIASMWYEEAAWDEGKYSPAGSEQTYGHRFYYGGLRTMLEERVETVLPEGVEIHVGKRPKWLPEGAKGWSMDDIMITQDGLYFPDPGPAPEWEELLEAIERGIAGNPVFTDSNPTCA
jgi:hypothetical protein